MTCNDHANAHTLGRVLARELSEQELETVSGAAFTLTCSDETITDCDTDDCKH